VDSLAEAIRKRRQEAGLIPPGGRVETAGLSLDERIHNLTETIKYMRYDRMAVAEELSSILSDNKITQTQLAKRLGRTQGWISTKLALLIAPGERGTKVTIPRSQAVEVVRLMRDNGRQHGISIELSKKPTNKEIFAAFKRAKNVTAALLKS